jgi:hypothetical protein
MSCEANTPQLAVAVAVTAAPSAQPTVEAQLVDANTTYVNAVAAAGVVEPSCMGTHNGRAQCGCGYTCECIENIVGQYTTKRALYATYTRNVCNIKITGMNTANCVCAHCIYMTTPFAYLFGVVSMIVATPICFLCDVVNLCDNCC